MRTTSSPDTTYMWARSLAPVGTAVRPETDRLEAAGFALQARPILRSWKAVRDGTSPPTCRSAPPTPTRSRDTPQPPHQEDSMKISARNRLTGRVTGITRGEAIANVAIDVGGTRIVASITVEAVEELGLAEGSRGHRHRQGQRRHRRHRLRLERGRPPVGPRAVSTPARPGPGRSCTGPGAASPMYRRRIVNVMFRRCANRSGRFAVLLLATMSCSLVVALTGCGRASEPSGARRTAVDGRLDLRAAADEPLPVRIPAATARRSTPRRWTKPWPGSVRRARTRSRSTRPAEATSCGSPGGPDITCASRG